MRSLDVSPRMDLHNQYASVLQGKRPEQHQEMPGVDAPWSVDFLKALLAFTDHCLRRYWEFSRRNDGYTDPFPGLHLHKVDMTAYNSTKNPLEQKSLKYYSVRGAMPSIEEDVNMHVCAHLYASDRNSLFVMYVQQQAYLYQSG